MARDRTARPEAKPLRLFAAVDVPAAVKADLLAATTRFHQRIPGGRWTHPEGWHITLKFMGATWPRLLEEVRAAVSVAAVEVPPFQTALTELGVFPGPTRARVVWAGLSDPDGRFARLASRLDGQLEDLFVPERRPFVPHLTLARLAPPRNLGEFAPELAGTSVASEPFPATALVLYRSHLSSKGARYEPLLAVPLGRDA